MNIFTTSKSPLQSARYLDDKRLIKMVLESAQLLSTALRVRGYTGDDVYKFNHLNHPCSIWARTSRGNYAWLLAHFRSLAQEYTKRTGKSHKSFELFPIFVKNIDLIPQGKRTEFTNCAANASLGLDFKHLPVLQAYREYLSIRFLNDKRPAKVTVRL